MYFLVKLYLCFLFLVITIIPSIKLQQQYFSVDNSSSIGYRDWKKMSVLVADLVGKSAVEDKTKTKFNVLALIIQVASGVIGHGANTLRTLVLNGLMLLSNTVLNASKDYQINQKEKPKEIIRGNPTDWIFKNSFVKSMIHEAINENLSDRLESIAFGMPCVQLLMCRIAPVLGYMQHKVKERWVDQKGKLPRNASGWDGIKHNGKMCSDKYYNCEINTKNNY
ncbi:uncharacterized protein LOC126905326 [Daktulosphaira vitifoliae]|uniref:uncharacterized protein LOC126905326 n=1 Tax=Daktulosphaira vitifoliae TaxID=58002 RepID=UPI0021AA936B|nr:uncharacterized protein LOC126905326 [Daktulosphaira vitifoliae]